MSENSWPLWKMTRTAFFGVLILALLCGLTLALPAASAKSTVTVSMPKGAGLPAGAPGYAPATAVVVIGVNNTVIWTNNDTASHTVTPGNQPAGGGWSVGSGDMKAGAVYQFTFTVPGTYNYSCAYHSWMFGSVIVKAAAISSSTTTSTSTTPEFPVAYLAVILFAIVAAVMVAAPRLKPAQTLPPR